MKEVTKESKIDERNTGRTGLDRSDYASDEEGEEFDENEEGEEA